MSASITAGGTDADRIAAAVLSCPGVAALHGGRFGEVATYLPGRRVAGIRVGLDTAAGCGAIDTVEVHVVGRFPAPVAEIARQVRSTVRPVVGSARVDVVVGDYAGEPGPPATSE